MKWVLVCLVLGIDLGSTCQSDIEEGSVETYICTALEENPSNLQQASGESSVPPSS